MNKYFFLAGLIGTLLISACKKDERNIQQFDADNIQAYIKANNLQMTQYGNTGIYYQVVTPGTGAILDYSDLVFFTYTERSLDGRYVSTDETTNRFTNYLGYAEKSRGYPDSWKTIVKEILMKKGGSVRILIPSAQAYGTEGNGKVPGNASIDCTLNISTANNITEFEDVYTQRYIVANNITGLTKTKEGLYYQIITPGTGATVTSTSSVTVDYTGKLTSGTVFETNTGLSLSLNGGVIRGFTIGLPYIQTGGTIRLIIPPALAYGTQPQSAAIPINAILDFNVKVTAVTN